MTIVVGGYVARPDRVFRRDGPALTVASWAEWHDVLVANRPGLGRHEVDEVARDRLVGARRQEQRSVSPAVDGQQRRFREQVRDRDGALVRRGRVELVADDEDGVARSP